MKIMIEVSGGLVCNIMATEEISIYLINHDNLKVGESAEYINDDVENAKQAFQPDLITDEDDFMERLNETLAEYTEKET